MSFQPFGQIFAGPLAKAFRESDFLVPLTAQSTEFNRAYSLYSQLPNLSSIFVDLAMGFPPVDILDCGLGVVSYAVTKDKADNDADELLEMLNAEECRFVSRLIGAEQAVKRTMESSGSVIISDPQDNPDAGGTGNPTVILRALVTVEAKDTVLGSYTILF